MKFYDRKKEIEILRRNWEKSAKHSLFTVMIGRRRIGKTLLLLKTEQEQKMLYLYVSKDNERVLAEKFQRAAEEVLGLQVYGRMETFAQFFEQIMKYGKEHHFTIVFDEFQNFLKVNQPSQAIFRTFGIDTTNRQWSISWLVAASIA